MQPLRLTRIARPVFVRALVGVVVGALVALCVGCPGSLEDPGRFAVDDSGAACPDITQTLFPTDCATAQCHSATAKQQGLDLQSPDVLARLVGVPATGGPGLLIDPATPQASVIYTKLTATPPFGAQMPFGETPLDDATVACVLQWITVQVDGGASDGSTADATVEDGSPGDDATAPAGDDGPSDEASPGPGNDGASEAAAPLHDAGSPRDAATMHLHDASTSPPDAGASAPDDAEAD
jgi:hypothetical protein